MLTTNATFDAVINDDGAKPVTLVEIGADTDWYFSTKELAAGAGAGFGDYNDILTDVSSLEQALPKGESGVAVTSDITIRLNNVNPKKNTLISSTIANGTLENKEVIIKFGFLFNTDASTDFLLTNFITVFTGIVKDYNLTNEDAEVVVVLTSILHDLGMIISRENHEVPVSCEK